MFSKILGRTAVAAAAAGLALTASMGTAHASTGAPYVGYGYANNGHAVWCVQHLANDLALIFDHPAISEDGVWGQQTYNQVRWVQAEFSFLGLKQDGIVGQQTGRVLLEYGDQYYGGNGYCMAYVPSDVDYVPPPVPVILD